MVKSKLSTVMVLFAAIAFLVLTGCDPVPDDNDSLETDLWKKSAHADKTAEAFTHWDKYEPPEIPVNCAKCHSTEGFIDFLGGDGSTEGIVDNPVSVGDGTNNINCLACHEDEDDGSVRAISMVKFPSGTEIDNTGNDATCLNCHQGTRSGSSVETAVADSGAGEDEISENLAFINSHYSVAGAILYGSDVKGGYEYPGETYSGKFGHGNTNLNTCIACHNPHSLEVEVELDCNTCHRSGFEIDGRKPELAELQAQLYQAIQVYAVDYTGVALVYDENTYPYFFADISGDGESDVQYNKWTPRMLKAAFNFHMSKKDKGAHIHNIDYVMQLLQTSLDDINSVL